VVLVEGGRGHGSVRVLVGVHAGVDRAAVHDVVGGRHLLRAAAGHRGRLQSHLRRRLGQLTHARRSVKLLLLLLLLLLNEEIKVA